MQMYKCTCFIFLLAHYPVTLVSVKEGLNGHKDRFSNSTTIKWILCWRSNSVLIPTNPRHWWLRFIFKVLTNLATQLTLPLGKIPEEQRD